MHRKAIKYIHQKGNPTEREVWLDPSSKACELYKDKQWDELNKHLDLIWK
jgi:hypothetical protein